MKVSQKAPQADSDWTTWAEFDCAGKDDTISWVFVPSGCTQQLEPVKTGTRVDIIFEVFTTSNHPIPQKPMGLLNELKTALNDPLILPNGGILAFGLQGAYPDIPEDPSHRLSTLQGEDRVWAGVLTEAGIPHEVVAVYAHPDRTNDDEYARRSAKLYAGRVPMVSRDFFLNYCKSKAERQPESMYSGDDIVWVTMPAAYSLDNFLHNSVSKLQSSTADTSGGRSCSRQGRTRSVCLHWTPWRPSQPYARCS
jgi:hypothetical protein